MKYLWLKVGRAIEVKACQRSDVMVKDKRLSCFLEFHNMEKHKDA